MTKSLDSNGLQSIADNYDLFYIDLWGVVHNGVKLHKFSSIKLYKYELHIDISPPISRSERLKDINNASKFRILWFIP